MGFFQDLKQDLSLAVNELLPEEEKTVEESASMAEDVTEYDESDVDVAMEELKEALSAEFVEKTRKEEAPTEATEALMDAASQQLAGIAGMVAREDPVKANIPVSEQEVTSVEEMQIGEQEVTSEDEVQIAAQEPASMMGEEMTGAKEEPVSDETAKLQAAVQEPEEELKEREPIVRKEMLESLSDRQKQETNLEKEVGKVIEKQKMNLADEAVSDEDAIITAGMEITGDVVSKGNVTVEGCVRGNIEVLGKLCITGKLEGDAKAAEVFADSANIVGTIIAEGTVKIGEDSVVIGNLQASSAVIAGAIKGDLDVHGPVILDTHAIVMGNIKSKSVQINNGATIEGMCSQCYAQTSPTAFFDNLTKKK